MAFGDRPELGLVANPYRSRNFPLAISNFLYNCHHHEKRVMAIVLFHHKHEVGYLIMQKSGMAGYCVILIAMMVLCLFGCDKSKAIKTDLVEGVITMDGSPLAGATVTFSPVSSDGNLGVGTTDSTGLYKIQTLQGAADAGTTPGDYIVTVSKKEGKPSGKQEMSESEGKMVDILTYTEAVPQKFTDKKATPHKATVAAGMPNKFDFDVSK